MSRTCGFPQVVAFESTMPRITAQASLEPGVHTVGVPGMPIFHRPVDQTFLLGRTPGPNVKTEFFSRYARCSCLEGGKDQAK